MAKKGFKRQIECKRSISSRDVERLQRKARKAIRSQTSGSRMRLKPIILASSLNEDGTVVLLPKGNNIYWPGKEREVRIIVSPEVLQQLIEKQGLIQVEYRRQKKE